MAVRRHSGIAPPNRHAHFKRAFRRCKDSLNPGGTYLATDGLQNLILTWWTSRIGHKRVLFPIPSRYTNTDVVFVKELNEAGHYRAVIDRCYPLEQSSKRPGTSKPSRRPETSSSPSTTTTASSKGR